MFAMSWRGFLLSWVELFCLSEMYVLGVGLPSPPGSVRFAAVGMPQREADHMNDASSVDGSKSGAFKIDDGPVVGAGTFEITPEGRVDVGVNLKIKPEGGTGVGTETGSQTPAPAVGQTPSPAPVPGQTPSPAPVPGQTPSSVPVPGQTPSPAPVPGQKPSPAPVPGQTPAPGSTPGQTPAPPAGEQPTPPGEKPSPPGGKPTPGPVATPAPAPAGASGSSFEQEGLKEHNKYRAIHGAPAMTLNAEMSAAAAEYAQKIAAQGSLMHSTNLKELGQGENLSMGCGSSGQTAAEAVKNWYDEVCQYTFGSGFSGGTGHFTQVVWKASTELGMGKADKEENGMKCTYIVGRYKPPGNFGDTSEYVKNVEKGSFDKTATCSGRKKAGIFNSNSKKNSQVYQYLRPLRPRGFKRGIRHHTQAYQHRRI